MKLRARDAVLVAGLTGALVVAVNGMSATAGDERTDVISATIRGVEVAQTVTSLHPNASPLQEHNSRVSELGHDSRYLSIPESALNDMAIRQEEISATLTGEQLELTGSALTNEISRLQEVTRELKSPSAISGEETVDYSWSGGVSDFKPSSVEINGSHATVSGTALLWSSGVAVGNG